MQSGATVHLYYWVIDPQFSSHSTAVVIRIRDAKGKLRKTITLGSQPAGAIRMTRYVCRLPKGVYNFSVYATDTAGNVQARIGSNLLHVG